MYCSIFLCLIKCSIKNMLCFDSFYSFYLLRGNMIRGNRFPLFDFTHVLKHSRLHNTNITSYRLRTACSVTSQPFTMFTKYPHTFYEKIFQISERSPDPVSSPPIIGNDRGTYPGSGDQRLRENWKLFSRGS